MLIYNSQHGTSERFLKKSDKHGLPMKLCCQIGEDELFYPQTLKDFFN